MNPRHRIRCPRYLDAQAAFDWLFLAFGFSRQIVHAQGVVLRHTQLVVLGG